MDDEVEDFLERNAGVVAAEMRVDDVNAIFKDCKPHEVCWDAVMARVNLKEELKVYDLLSRRG